MEGPVLNQAQGEMPGSQARTHSAPSQGKGTATTQQGGKAMNPTWKSWVLDGCPNNRALLAEQKSLANSP